MIEFSHVSKRYDGGADALRDVSFSVGSGEVVFVTGHSGAGKTTLLRLIGGLETLSRGRVDVDGLSVGELSRRRRAELRRRIGFVFQDHRLLPERSVFDNVGLPLVVRGAPANEVGRRVRAALDKVGLLDKVSMLPGQLSGGEQQRVGIARAVVGRPAILVADEPTGNLDPALAREVMSLFGTFAEVGSSVVIATHDLMLLREYPWRILALNEGRLLELDRSELYSR
ncbi:MAG: cell division transport system ATP-binding protein [Gammaproteobacteria bacterium]|jgi:cell division transport system ATP-binding protein